MAISEMIPWDCFHGPMIQHGAISYWHHCSFANFVPLLSAYSYQQQYHYDNLCCSLEHYIRSVFCSIS